ncbi:MAG: molybdate ABC transporter substrate-binding protein [Woeseiaceae bacterium]
MSKFLWRCTLLTLALPLTARAEEALIAIATNFAGVARHIETEFEAVSSHRITFVTGSTGKLFAQIVNGAPFDVLLAADQERPRLLEEAGLAITGSRFTFAVGRLVVASRDAEMIGSGLRETLSHPGASKLAIANPALAPYGLASKKILQNLDLWAGARHKVVMGENIGQTYALVATGNADMGFVALSQVIGQRHAGLLTYVDVPERLHDPIRQDAVLLSHGQGNAAARDFLAFLASNNVQMLVSASGYGSDTRFAD